MCLYLSGYTLKHHEQLTQLFRSGLARRTWQNKALHIKKYIAFCTSHNVSPLLPSVYDLLSFLLFLSTLLSSPGAVMNYFSSVKLWVTAAPGSHPQFAAPELNVMKRAIFKSSKHVPNPPPSVPPDQFRLIISHLVSLNPTPYAHIVALLIAYLTLMRQSNLLSRDPHAPGPHVLRFADVRLRRKELLVTLRSSKTRFQSAVPLVYRLPASTNPICCPVRAWRLYINTVDLSPRDPALLLPTRVPLSVRALLTTLRAAAVAVSGSHNRITLHSLRRGAVQACQQAHLPLPGIMAAGTWKSAAVTTYLARTVVDAAPAALTQLLA